MKVTIYNKFCQITNEDDAHFLKLLDKELSFRIQGAEYSPAFKCGRWDGFQRILTSDLKFSYGLLPRVIDFYSNHNKQLTVEDERLPKSISSKIDIITKLNSLGKPPRKYQMDVLNVIDKSDCGILRLATGAGKTILSALMTAHVGKPTIIFVIGTTLLHQTKKLFQSLFDQPIGIVGDGLCEIHDINIVSVWTAGQALGLKGKEIGDDIDDDEIQLEPNKYDQIKDMLKRTKLVIYDECHLASAQTFQSIAKSANPEYVYGMSATPWRDDGSDLMVESILGKYIVDVPASTLIDQGYLIKPIIKFIKAKKHPEKLPKNYQTIYKKYIVENEDRNKQILDAAVKLTNLGYQTLVSFNSINHGNILFDLIKKQIPSLLLSGKDSSEVRDDALNKIENKTVKCLIASKIADIGWDCPIMSGLIIASGGKSSVRSLQRVGRVIRPYPGKKSAAIVDFYDDVHYLKDHSKSRYEIYTSERAFDVTWVK